MVDLGGIRTGWAVRGGLILAALLFLAVGLAPGPARAGGVRYLDPVFADVVVTPDQHYRTALDCTATPVDLHLDLYEPQSDTATDRPLYVWIHGGSFSSGDRAGPLEVAVATDFARRGYVVASIQYRLCGSPDLDTILEAGEDAAAAVAHLRSRADELGIDPERVAVGGASAGAITATLVGYEPDRSLGEGDHDDPAHADAIVSIAGFGFDGLLEVGEPPLFMAHGTDDPIIPIATARSFCDAADATGIGCEFHEYPAGHESLVDYFVDIEAAVFPWLYGVLGLAPPAQAPTTTTASTTTTTAPAPAPSSLPSPTTRPPVGTPPAFTG